LGQARVRLGKGLGSAVVGLESDRSLIGLESGWALVRLGLVRAGLGQAWVRLRLKQAVMGRSGFELGRNGWSTGESLRWHPSLKLCGLCCGVAWNGCP